MTERSLLELSVEPDVASRLRVLVEAGVALSSELTLESLLRRLIGTAVDLTGASYGAMGVIDRAGTGLDQFITVGMKPDVIATIGYLPLGRGILAHPQMDSFLVVPVTIRDTAFGNLYLADKVDAEEFTDEDEEIIRLLAGQAAVAIENARLCESTQLWSRQLESLNEISETLATEVELVGLLQLAATRLCGLLDARVVMIQLLTPDGLSLTVEAVDGDGSAQLLGLTVDLSRSKSGLTLMRGLSERIDSLIDDPEVDQTAPRLVDATSALYVPLVVRDRAAGVVVVYDKRGLDHRFSEGDMRIAQAFATRAAVAIDLSERVGREAVRALLRGQEVERSRLARELHDETGQALASILLGLKRLEREVGEEPLREIRDLVASALDDIRRLTIELRPPALDDFGLQSALEYLTQQVAQRSGLNVQLHAALLEGALEPEQETTIYRIVQEALTNIVKYANANSVSIVVTTAEGVVRAVIEDDGVGFAVDQVRKGALGLVGMKERVMLLGGRFEIESAPHQGTTLVAELWQKPTREAPSRVSR